MKDPIQTTPDPAVETLQHYLRNLGTEAPQEGSIPPVDGIFGEDTAASLRNFQSANGLSPTGTADKETWEALYLAYLESLFRTSEPLPLPVFPKEPRDYRLTRGDRSFAVLSVQYLLRELSSVTREGFSPPLDGVYGEKTAEAVREFQRLTGLSESGEVDKRTWNALIELTSALAVTQEAT